MGKNIKFTLIAEGIEQGKQLSYLKQQDCHEGQGYLFSKPIPAEQVQLLLSNYQFVSS